METGGFWMKPDFKKMPRKELIAYVLAHRNDDEAFQVLIARRSPDSEATWYNFPYTEEGQRQMEEVFRRKINGEL
ncbi:hypothetical protein SD81_027780 [Tolypothrix campylonemoides VB511288]|nr:hypothetical protein SD81_027780 [Tolypothrix campylonemoides VB511288]